MKYILIWYTSGIVDIGNFLIKCSKLMKFDFCENQWALYYGKEGVYNSVSTETLSYNFTYSFKLPTSILEEWTTW
jgi:hypothetical protein